jgi:hypothetical protein
MGESPHFLEGKIESSGHAGFVLTKVCWMLREREREFWVRAREERGESK